jgi:hypothetical protein
MSYMLEEVVRATLTTGIKLGEERMLDRVIAFMLGDMVAARPDHPEIAEAISAIICEIEQWHKD